MSVPDGIGGKKGKKSDAPTPALPVDPVRLKEEEMLKLIEQNHYCNEHKKLCLVQDGGEHYQYTLSDLTTWAKLMSQQKAVIDTPPDALNLMDAFTCQKSVKKAHNAMQLNNTVNDSEPPKWLQQVLQFQMAAAMMGGPFGGAGIAAGFHAQPELPHTPSPLPLTPSTPLQVSSVPPPM